MTAAPDADGFVKIDEVVFCLKKPETGAFQFKEAFFADSRILSLKFTYYSVPFKYKLLPLGLEADLNSLTEARKSELVLKILHQLTFGSSANPVNEKYLQKLDAQINKILNEFIVVLLQKIRKVLHTIYGQFLARGEQVYEYLERTSQKSKRNARVRERLGGLTRRAHGPH